MCPILKQVSNYRLQLEHFANYLPQNYYLLPSVSSLEFEEILAWIIFRSRILKTVLLHCRFPTIFPILLLLDIAYFC